MAAQSGKLGVRLAAIPKPSRLFLARRCRVDRLRSFGTAMGKARKPIATRVERESLGGVTVGMSNGLSGRAADRERPVPPMRRRSRRNPAARHW